MDWDSCRNVNPIGQSEKYGSVHYHDQTELWATGEMKPMRCVYACRTTTHRIHNVIYCGALTDS